MDGGKIINDKGASIDAKYGGVIDIGWADVENHRGALIEASHHGEISLFDADLDNKGTIKSEDCSCISIVGRDDGSVLNVGLIEAKSFGEVKFDGLGSVVNDDGGEIEAKDHGTVLFEDVVATNYDGGTDSGAGLIAADGCGSTVELANASIDGGTVQSRDGGKIEAIYGDNEFLDVTINGGIVQVDRHATLALEGHTVIEKDTTFEGQGVFVLDGDDSITGEGSAVTLKNDSTIAGGGTIGGDGLKLINEAWGTILADGGKNDPLVINTDGNKVINDGLMEAVYSSTLDIDSKLDNYGHVIAEFGGNVVDDANVVNEAGGRIEALQGGTVTLDGNKITNDGAGECTPGALIMADGDGSKVVIKSSTVDNDAKIDAENGGVVDIFNTKVHNDDGRIEASGWGSAVVLAGSDVIGGDISVEHHGALDVTSDSTLKNVDVTDSAGADIVVKDDAVLTLDGGTIVSGSGKLTIEHGSELLIESSDGATLDGVDVANHGKIQVDLLADPTTVPLVLENSTTIHGGELNIGGEGRVDVEGTGATFDGVTVDVSDGGEIQVGQAHSATSFFVSDLAASGTVLTLDDDTIITGGASALVVEPNSEVDVATGAKGTGATLEGVDVRNAGLVQVEQGAILTLEGATDEGGMLFTVGSPYSDGGIIEVSATGGTTTFDGTSNAVTEEGYVKVDAGADLELKGTIDVDNDNFTTFGIIDLYDSGVASGTLDISGTVTLGGTDGEIVLGGGDASIVGAASGAVLDNGIYIYGAGNIGHDGDKNLTFNNSGYVVAYDGTAAPLVIDTGNDVTNTGTLKADDGILQIDDNVTNNNEIVATDGGTVILNGDTVTNTTGNIEVDAVSAKSFSTLDLEDGTISGGTITLDGLLDSTGNSFIEGATISGSGTTQVESGAVLTLEGVTYEGGTLLTVGDPYSNGGVIEVSATGGTTTFDGTSSAVTEEGYVKVDAGADLELKGAINVDNDNATTFGIIDLYNSGVAGGALEISGAVTLCGSNGEIVLGGGDTSIVAAASGAVLDNGMYIYGAGNIGHAGDHALTFDNSGYVIADAGTSAPIVIDTGNDVSNTGTLQADNGTLQIDDNIVDNNMIVGADSGTVVLNGISVSGGKISIESVQHPGDRKRR